MPDDDNKDKDKEKAKPSSTAVLPPDVVQVIQTLPVEKRAAVERVVVRAISRYHSGPLPDAETLERYAKVIPNAGERMMALVEREAAHRRQAEKDLVACQTTLAKRGQWIGAVLTVMLTGAGAYLGLLGHDWLAGGIFTATIGGVVTIFVLQRSGRGADEGNGSPTPNDSADAKKKRKSG